MEILFVAFDRGYLDRAFFWLKKQLSVYNYVESSIHINQYPVLHTFIAIYLFNHPHFLRP